MAEVAANGNGLSVPHFGEAADFEGPIADAGVDAVIEDTNSYPPPEEEPDVPSRNLYFVRIPKPVVDDSAVKKLQEKFQKDIAELKVFNSKLQAKRAELNDLRSKLREARSLKDGVSPEFGEKAGVLEELRQKRAGYIRQIKDIRMIAKGLDCRSEEELDAKINELEASIRAGEISIRVERETVKMIARLNAQREKVREYEAYKDLLSQHEEELEFIKRCIDDLESEFSVLRGEKQATDSIIKEWKAKLEAKQEEMKELEELQQVAVDAKNRTMEELTAAREKIDVVMNEYRENRKFSATVRDLVESGQADQAREMVLEQVEQYLKKLNSDPKYRAAYFKLWESQRRFPVSELLPKSCNQPVAVQPKSSKPVAKPPQPQGKKKAEAIIAGLLESTRQELSERRQTFESDYSEPEPEVLPLPKPSAKPEPKAIAPRSSDTVFKHKVEMPSIENAYDSDFVPPVIKSTEPQLSDAELKAKIRAEQKAKAQEAEERKKRLEKKKQETQEKKKQRALSKKLEASANVAARVDDAQPATDESAAEQSAGEEEPAPVVEEKPQPQRRARGVQKNVVVPPAEIVAKRPKKEKNKLKSIFSQYQGLIVLGVVLFITLVAIIFALFTR